MKLKLALAALVVSVLPSVAIAACGHSERKMSTSVCADGQTWDASTQTCVDASA